MATEVVSSIRSSGGDYTSLSAWEAGEQRNLVAADEIAVAECYGDWPSGLTDNIGIAGWVADATRYIHIRAAAGHEHNGVRLAQGGSGFCITSSYLYGTVRPAEDKVLIDDIEIINTGGPAIDYFSVAPAGSVVEIDRCILDSSGLVSGDFSVDLSSSGGHAYLRRSLVLSDQRGVTFSGNVDAVAESCVVVGSGSQGVYGALSTNVATYGFAADFVSAISGSDYCASGDGSAPGANSITGINATDFADAANDDFSLATGSSLESVGYDLSANFTTDIAGVAFGASWDIGAFSAAGGSTPTNIGPGLGSIGITGVGVSLSAQVDIAPTKADMAIAGAADPVVEAVVDLPVAAGSLSLAGADVSVDAIANVSPGLGSASLAGKPVDLSSGYVLSPGAGQLDMAGQAVSLDSPSNIAPGIGGYAITGHAVAVLSSVEILPAIGSSALSGFDLSLLADVDISPGVGSLSLNGFSVTVDSDNATNLAPGVGAMSLAGEIVGLSASVEITPTPAGMAITGGVGPEVTASHLLSPGVGAITLAGVAVNIDYVVSPTGLYNTGLPMLVVTAPTSVKHQHYSLVTSYTYSTRVNVKQQ